mmetsp:Transcript_98312/g.261192  ORF Transcript_98312/g.261192 Transcript_98312/m.261192 type:complete len:207 (-) Transcript_98312:926-1546(-)
MIQLRREVRRGVDAGAAAAVRARRGVGVAARVEVVQAVAEEARLCEAPVSEDLARHARRPRHPQRVAVGIGADDGRKHGGRRRQGGGLHERLHGCHVLGPSQHHDPHAGDGPRILQRGEDLGEGQRDAELGQHEPGPVRALDLHPLRALGASDELANDHRLLPLVPEEVHDPVHALLGDDEDHAQAAIEGGGQLPGADLPNCREPA